MLVCSSAIPAGAATSSALAARFPKSMLWRIVSWKRTQSYGTTDTLRHTDSLSRPRLAMSRSGRFRWKLRLSPHTDDNDRYKDDLNAYDSVAEGMFKVSSNQLSLLCA